MPTKIAVIGAGGMLQYHAAGFREAGAEIVAIADMNATAAAEAASQWGAAQSFGDVQQMLDESDADAVSIIVPNKFHAPLAIQCLNAGKHVFCEKPPALNADQVQEMVAAAKQADKMLMFNFNNRARPESCRMMELIADGTVGKINAAQAKWIRRFPAFPTASVISDRMPRILAGILLDWMKTRRLPTRFFRRVPPPFGERHR